MLKGDSVHLRAIEPYDIDILYKWENDTKLWLISNVTVPVSKHHLTQFVQEASLGIFETKQLRLMIDLNETGETIGCIDLFDFDAYHRRAGVGILINNLGQRNKGLASEALSLLIEYSFEFLNLHQLYCNILSDNLPSLKLFEKNKFKIIGVKEDWIFSADKWLNEYMLQRINYELK